MEESAQEAVAEPTAAPVPTEVSKDTLGEAGALSQIVTFTLADEEYGVNIMRVQEIILMGDITQVPEVPDFIEGVINLRGNVIPIVDLRCRFGIKQAEKTEETRIIVVNVNDKTMGIVVDAVNEVLRISDKDIEEAPPSISGWGKEYLQGLIKLDERLLILLDIDRILSLEEQQAMSSSNEA